VIRKYVKRTNGEVILSRLSSVLHDTAALIQVPIRSRSSARQQQAVRCKPRGLAEAAARSLPEVPVLLERPRRATRQTAATGARAARRPRAMAAAGACSPRWLLSPCAAGALRKRAQANW
jgi:hypothetical protein